MQIVRYQPLEKSSGWDMPLCSCFPRAPNEQEIHLALLVVGSCIYMLVISARVPRGQERGDKPPRPFVIPIARMFR
jgi:hypothetical protein